MLPTIFPALSTLTRTTATEHPPTFCRGPIQVRKKKVRLVVLLPPYIPSRSKWNIGNARDVLRGQNLPPSRYPKTKHSQRPIGFLLRCVHLGSCSGGDVLLLGLLISTPSKLYRDLGPRDASECGGPKPSCGWIINDKIRQLPVSRQLPPRF